MGKIGASRQKVATPEAAPKATPTPKPATGGLAADATAAAARVTPEKVELATEGDLKVGRLTFTRISKNNRPVYEMVAVTGEIVTMYGPKDGEPVKDGIRFGFA